MNKILVRIVSLLLVPCFLMDPLAAAVIQNPIARAARVDSRPFESQAVVPALLASLYVGMGMNGHPQPFVLMAKQAPISRTSQSGKGKRGREKNPAFSPDEKRFATESDLNYHQQSTAITPDEFSPRLPSYVARFLRHVNPEHPLVNRRTGGYIKAIEQDKRRGTRISVVHHLPSALLSQSEPYQRLLRDIHKTRAFENRKLHLIENQNLHFTLAGNLQLKQLSVPELQDWFRQAMLDFPAFSIQVRGLWSSDFIRGRAYLKNYPELSGSGKNRVSEAIAKLGGPDFKIYATGLFQLQDDLTPGEAEELAAVFSRYERTLFFEYPVTHLDLASFESDLLHNKQILETVPLASPGKVVALDPRLIEISRTLHWPMDHTREKFRMLRDRTAFHGFTNQGPHEKRRMTGDGDEKKKPAESPSKPRYVKGSIYAHQFVTQERVTSAQRPTVVVDLEGTLIPRRGDFSLREEIATQIQMLAAKGVRLVLWTGTPKEAVDHFFHKHPEFVPLFDRVITEENYKDISGFLKYCSHIPPTQMAEYIQKYPRAKNISLLGYGLLVDDYPKAAEQAELCPTGRFPTYVVSRHSYRISDADRANRDADLAQTVLAHLSRINPSILDAIENPEAWRAYPEIVLKASKSGEVFKLTVEKHHAFGIVLKGERVGGLTLIPVESSLNLNWIGLDENVRNKGIADAIMQRIAQEMRGRYGQFQMITDSPQLQESLWWYFKNITARIRDVWRPVTLTQAIAIMAGRNEGDKMISFRAVPKVQRQAAAPDKGFDVKSWVPFVIGTATLATLSRWFGAPGTELAMAVPIFLMNKRRNSAADLAYRNPFLRAA